MIDFTNAIIKDEMYEYDSKLPAMGSSSFDEYCKGLVKHVKDKYQERKAEKMYWTLQAILCIHFSEGNHYVDINEASKTIVPIPKGFKHTQQNVYNWVAGVKETREAQIIKGIPDWVALPERDTDTDRDKAKITTAVLKNVYNEQKLKSKIKDAITWSELTFTSFYKVTWNSDSGRAIGVIDGITVKEGDIDISVLNSFELFPDSVQAKNLQDCGSIIQEEVMTANEVYNKSGIRVKGTDINVYIPGYGGSISGFGYKTGNFLYNHSTKRDSVEWLEYYEKPTKEYIEGRTIVVAGDALISYSKMPYRVGKNNTVGYPFIPQHCIKNPGYLIGLNIIQRLIPLQRNYNALINRRNENIARAAIGNLSYYTGSLENEDSLKKEGMAPGAMLKIKDGKPFPKYLETPSLPSDVTHQLSLIENMISTVSGVSILARASEIPSSTMSGYALGIVSEQDKTRIGLTIDNVNEAVKQLGEMIARVYKQYSSTERIVRDYGEGDTPLVMSWTSDDLVVDNVQIDTENASLESPTQKKQTAFDILKSGIFGKTSTYSKREQRLIIEMLNLRKSWDAIGDDDEVHTKRAQKENKKLLEGIPPQINPFDESNLHLPEHIKMYFSEEFEKLKLMNPELAQYFEMHIMQHKEITNQQNMSAMQQQTIGG